MPRFRYTAADSDNREVAGELNAASADDARRQLEQLGMTPRSVKSASTAETGEQPMSAGGLGDVTGQIADITASGLPLAAGLRALSDEMPSRPLRRGFRRISGRLETGESLQSVLQSQKRLIPTEAFGVIDAGLKAGKLGLFLEQYLKHARDARELNRRVWLGLVYPIVLLVAGVAVSAAIPRWIVPQLVPLFDTFGMELPFVTVIVIALSDMLLWIRAEMLLGVMLAGIACWFVITMIAGRARIRRLIGAIPLLGARSRYLCLSRFCRCLALLIECRVPLPEALRIAGESTNDANVREGSAVLAKQVEQGNEIGTSAGTMPAPSSGGLAGGRELGRAPTEGGSAGPPLPAETVPHFPAELLHVFRWSDREEAFPAALRAAGDLYAARAGTQTELICVVIEPVVVIGVSLTVGLTVIACFMPLINLLTALI